jgi:hypothetical protein
MVHGVKSIFPFDLAEVTFLVPLPGCMMLLNMDLIAWHARQLQKYIEDLDTIKDKVLKVCFKSTHNFEVRFHASIKDHDFVLGTLVLVHNSKIEYKLSKKMKLWYLGPMIVVCCMKGGPYLLAELDGALSKLQYTAFCIIPYFPRSEERIAVTKIIGMVDESLDCIADEEDVEPDEEDPKCALDG